MYTPIIIVPYRNRADNLKEFIPTIKSYVPNAKILVIEQLGDGKWNKGSLINIGVLESGCTVSEYFIIHDVDLIPINADYSYPQNPTHIATEVEQYAYKMPYENYFGGVVAFTKHQFMWVNGFTNKILGWGCEDDLFYDSFIQKKIKVDRRMRGRFKSLWHERYSDPAEFGKNVAIWKVGRDYSEGMNTVKYIIDDIIENEDYTLIQVECYI